MKGLGGHWSLLWLLLFVIIILSAVHTFCIVTSIFKIQTGCDLDLDFILSSRPLVANGKESWWLNYKACIQNNILRGERQFKIKSYIISASVICGDTESNG